MKCLVCGRELADTGVFTYLGEVVCYNCIDRCVYAYMANKENNPEIVIKKNA